MGRPYFMFEEQVPRMLNPRTRACIAFETITHQQEGKKAKAPRNILRIERKSTMSKERMRSVRKN